MLNILTALGDQQRHNTTDLSESLEMKRSTAYGALQRLVVFGYVRDTLDIDHPSHRRDYQITKEGQQFLRKHVVHKKTDQPAYTKRESIVEWLRTMAQEMNRMADDLAIYES
jgi:DNA-binding IclR family transcriptional regulator